MRALQVSAELDVSFERFRRASSSERKQMLPELERLASEARPLGHSYISEKCTKFIESCKAMARLRQPEGYDEDRETALALGDLSMIQTLLKEASELKRP